jgi:hypothetical protein
MKEEEITIQEISNLFHLPLHQACIKLGRSKEELNKICRAYGKLKQIVLTFLGITRWPYSHRKKKTEKKEGNLFSNFVVDKPIALQNVTKPQKTKEHFEKKKTMLPALKEIKSKVEKEPDSATLQKEETEKHLEIQETRNKVMDVKHLCNF